MATKKKDENELKAEAQQAQAELAASESTPEQLEEAAAGRSTEKDRFDKKPPPAKEAKLKGFDSPTPSALALEKVGPDGDGEAYQEEKAKHRWG